MKSSVVRSLNWRDCVLDSIASLFFWIFISGCGVHVISTGRPGPYDIREEFSCFNTIFEISCQRSEILLFETARYGRNDSLGAVMCDLPFTRSCDVDVQYPLSRACGGRRKCSIAVNTAFFGDPCGYEEFLKVTYRCLPSTVIQRRCSESSSSSYRFLDATYLASPNYPGKYYPDGDCHWSLAVQPLQMIRLTLYDFELDVKRGGTCHDFVDVSSGNRTYFRDCGILGKQVIDVDASRANVSFRTGQTSLTQRGFILYVEAVGRGCELFSHLESLQVVYYLDGEEGLVANVTCDADHEFSVDGTDPGGTVRVLRCYNESWSMDLPRCMRSITVTTDDAIPAYNSTSSGEEFPAFLFSILIGVVSSALVLAIIIIVLAICCNRRRRLADRKRDEWRVVVNNLQDNVINDVTKALQMRDDFLQLPAKPSRGACAKRHNVWPNRNLLCASRDFYARQTIAKEEAGISGIRCALCWAEQNDETGDPVGGEGGGGYVGFVAPSPSSRGYGRGLLGRARRTRTRSEQLMEMCLDSRTISAWCSAPELSINKSTT